MIGWILRVFKTREEKPILTLYKALVLPHMDYCSLIWAPNSAKQKQIVEGVQRYLTRQINRLQGVNYWERLKRLRLFSLESCFKRYQISYVFKCLHGLVPNPGLIFSNSSRCGFKCNTIVPPRHQKKCTKAIQNHLVLYRGPALYNLIPVTMRRIYNCVNVVESFKNDFSKDSRSTYHSRPFQSS